MKKGLLYLLSSTANMYIDQNELRQISGVSPKFVRLNKEDWSSGYRGINSREQFFARYATLLADDPGQRKLVAEGRAALFFLDYDWSLNDARK